MNKKNLKNESRGEKSHFEDADFWIIWNDFKLENETEFFHQIEMLLFGSIFGLCKSSSQFVSFIKIWKCEKWWIFVNYFKQTAWNFPKHVRVVRVNWESVQNNIETSKTSTQTRFIEMNIIPLSTRVHPIRLGECQFVRLYIMNRDCCVADQIWWLIKSTIVVVDDHWIVGHGNSIPFGFPLPLSQRICQFKLDGFLVAFTIQLT